MPSVTRWLYLNIKYRVGALPNDAVTLEKLANELQIPLAFTYRAYGLDITLVQKRIRESLNSFRWIAPLVLCFALMVTIIILISAVRWL